MICPVVSLSRARRLPLTATVEVTPSFGPNMLTMRPRKPSSLNVVFSLVLTSADSAAVSAARTASVLTVAIVRFMSLASEAGGNGYSKQNVHRSHAGLGHRDRARRAVPHAAAAPGVG